MKLFAACVLGAILAAGTSVSSVRAAGATTVHTNKSGFAIPFRSDEAEIQRLGAREVRLYVSVDNGGNWHQVQTMQPTAERFNVRAPKSGEYWFAVRTVDRNGRLQPDRALGAELKVVVDTESPTLDLRLAESAPGTIQLTWEAADRFLDPSSLLIEYRAAGDTNWSRVFAEQKNAGTTTWSVPNGGVVEVRGRISDRASNVAVAQDSIRIAPDRSSVPKPSVPDLNEPVAITPNDGTSGSRMSAQFPNSGTKRQTARQISSSETGPILHGFQPAREGETPQKPITQSPNTSAPQPGVLSDSGPTIVPNGQAMPTNVVVQKPVLPEQQFSQFPPKQQTVVRREPKKPSIPTRLVAQRDFRLNYAVEKIGRSGVESVELFITPDKGKKWYRYGTDADRTSPFDVAVPRDGEYGFAIRVKSGVGLADPPPKHGDAPELVVVVDQTAPVVELLPVLQGRGADSHKFLICWKLNESHPASKPITVSYAESTNGPWTTVAAEVANTGKYLWSAPESVPARIYLRVTAVDAAGNVGTAETPRPIIVDIVKPSARITNVDVDPSR